MEGLRHPSGGPDHLSVGGCAGQTDQNVLSRSGSRLVSRLLSGPVQTVCRPPEGDFPQCRQVFQGKEVAERALGLLGLINLPRLKARDQVRRLDVDHLNLVG